MKAYCVVTNVNGLVENVKLFATSGVVDVMVDGEYRGLTAELAAKKYFKEVAIAAGYKGNHLIDVLHDGSFYQESDADGDELIVNIITPELFE